MTSLSIVRHKLAHSQTRHPIVAPIDQVSYPVICELLNTLSIEQYWEEKQYECEIYIVETSEKRRNKTIVARPTNACFLFYEQWHNRMK